MLFMSLSCTLVTQKFSQLLFGLFTDNPMQLQEDKYKLVLTSSTNHQFKEDTEKALNQQLWNDYSEQTKIYITTQLVKQVLFDRKRFLI